MESISADIEGMGMRGFLDRFILFHLGRDAEVDVKTLPDGSMICSLGHSRVQDISFELDPSQVQQFSQDVPAFEDFLLDLLTRNRKGLSID
jgi:hypothetical protein